MDLNNTTNESYSLNIRSDALQKLVEFLAGLDITCRVLSLIVHVLYFVAVLLIKDLKTWSLIYIHQVNFYGLLFLIHFSAYIGSTHPNFSDANLNYVLCSMSEFTWSALKYLRSYSILLLASFRMMAVLNPQCFKRWTSSIWIIHSTNVSIIVITIVLTQIPKYVFNTTFGDFLCNDGFSPIFEDGMRYFIFCTLLNVLIPCILVFIIYVLVNRSIKKLSRKLSSQNPLSSRHSSASLSQKSQLAQQFFLINICLLASLLSFAALNLANLLEDFSFNLYHWRLLIRIISVLSQALVPIVSLYGHPKIKRSLLFRKSNNSVSVKGGLA